MDNLILLILPLAITTLLLAVQARWAWLRTQDKILRGMKLDEVIKRAQTAKWHRLAAGIHSLVAIPAMIFVFTRLLFTGNSLLGQDMSTSGLIFWLYVFYLPHLLALYLYHLRWNPQTVARKQKLDAEDFHYEGDYRLKEGVQYRLGEDGELIEVEESEAMTEENS
jgi:hypothetical protein